MKFQITRVRLFFSAVSILSVILAIPSIEGKGGPNVGRMGQGGQTGRGLQGVAGNAGFGSNPSVELNQNVQQVSAQPGRGFRGGGGRGRQGGPGDAAHAVDMKAIQFLLANRSKIQRTVKNLPDGVETVTESDDPEVTKVLVEHVNAMYKRVEENRPIHARDPLFAELFRNASTLVMKVEKTEKGVKVIETSKNPFSAKLIQAHAKVVSLFLKNGHAEVRKNHAVPE